MVLYTTLKANKEHGIDYYDIARYCDESLHLVAYEFENPEKYFWHGSEDYTDLDKLYEDYTPRQVASAVLKYLKADAKDKDGITLNYAPLKVFFELDCDGEIAYDQIEDLIKAGEITSSSMLHDIDSKARKKGVRIKKGYRYGENDIYYGEHSISYLSDQYFPCKEALMVDEDGEEYMGCTNCGNCH